MGNRIGDADFHGFAPFCERVGRISIARMGQRQPMRTIETRPTRSSVKIRVQLSLLLCFRRLNNYPWEGYFLMMVVAIAAL
jgi:hypothetical protein